LQEAHAKSITPKGVIKGFDPLMHRELRELQFDSFID